MGAFLFPPTPVCRAFFSIGVEVMYVKLKINKISGKRSVRNGEGVAAGVLGWSLMG